MAKKSKSVLSKEERDTAKEFQGQYNKTVTKPTPVVDNYKAQFDDLINQAKTQLSNAGTISPELSNAVAGLQQQWLNSGQTSPEVQTSLDALRETWNSAGMVDPREQQLIDQIFNIANQGFSPEQLQIAREKARSSISGGLQGAMRNSLLTGIIRNVGGGLNLKDSLPQQQIAANALTNLERDLMLENVNRMDSARTAGLSAMDSLNKRVQGQKLDASGNYFTGASANDQFNRSEKERALANYANFTESVDDRRRAARTEAFNNLTGLISGQSSKDIALQGANQDALKAFQLGGLGAWTGGLSFAGNEKLNQQIMDLNKQMLDIAQKNGGSTSRTSFQSPSAFTTPSFSSSGGGGYQYDTSTPATGAAGAPVNSSTASLYG